MRSIECLAVGNANYIEAGHSTWHSAMVATHYIIHYIVKWRHLVITHERKLEGTHRVRSHADDWLRHLAISINRGSSMQNGLIDPAVWNTRRQRLVAVCVQEAAQDIHV